MCSRVAIVHTCCVVAAPTATKNVNTWPRAPDQRVVGKVKECQLVVCMVCVCVCVCVCCVCCICVCELYMCVCMSLSAPEL